MFKHNKTLLTLLALTSMLMFSHAQASDWKTSAVTLDSSALESLIHKPISSETFNISGFPQRLHFKRIQPYAKNAIIHVLSDAGNHTLQPSKRIFLMSNNTVDKVALSFDVDNKTLNGHIHSNKEKYHINGLKKKASHHLTIVKEDDDHSFDCANDNLNQWELSLNPPTQALANKKTPTRLGGNPLYAAQIKVDTDNEFLWNKFNNNTASARDWIEDLFLNMNLIYESEVDLHLAINSMVLRVDTTPANNPNFDQDPNGFNDSLNQFSNYWNGQNGNNNTVFTALLAGKDISGFSFSGIAWVYGYCSSQYGYSINRLGSSFHSVLHPHL